LDGFSPGRIENPSYVAGARAAVEPRDRLLEVVPLDEAHGVKRPAVGVRTEPVDRHDAGVLQAAGYLRLQDEAAAAVGVVGMERLDLLESDLAVQLLVKGDENLAQAPLGMRPQHPVAETVPPDEVHGADGGSLVGRAAMRQAGLDIGIGDCRQRLAYVRSRGEGR
jgi:hypothetical protein